MARFMKKMPRWLGGAADETPPAPSFEGLEHRLLLSLLGIGEEIGLPDVDYDANGTLVYSEAADTLNADAAPTAISFTLGARPVKISNPRDFQLHIRVDDAGALLGGVEGHDLLVEGVIDINRDGVPEYDGVLLTGEIVAFGYLDNGSSPDQYDFRFTPTGGDLMPFFENKDIGLDMLSLASTFDGSFAVDFTGGAQGVFGPIEPLAPPAPGSLAGVVFDDLDNNGVMDTGETGIADVIVTLTGTDINGQAVNMATVTAEDGSYAFTGLVPGDYTIAETQPGAYLDGADAAGTLGGVVADDVISVILVGEGDDGTGYTFAELQPASLSGFVFEDFNNDGLIDFSEKVIESVTVELAGMDDRGAAVAATALTDADGMYFFADLRPGTYAISEIQPAGLADGIDSLGTAGGTLANDVVSDIGLGVGVDGSGYNFGERPEAGAAVASGQTATIGFWQNKNGQDLIKALNGGSTSTQLGNWLAATFPNMYGAAAGARNLADKTNAEVADFYKNQLFKAKKAKGQTGPAKVDAQVMATAFAVYVTNATLAGTTAASYGFLVTDYGVGIATFNVGDAGAAFGVENDTLMAVLDLLLSTNDQAVDGVLYDLDAALRSLANEVYTAINEAGDI